MKLSQIIIAAISLVFAINFTQAATPDAQEKSSKQSGETVYYQRCASCHEGGVAKAPHKLFLSMMAADAIYGAVDGGVMQVQAAALSKVEKIAVAEYLSGSKLGDTDNKKPLNLCSGEQLKFDLAKPPAAVSWGINRNNQRYIPKETANLTVEQIPRLKLKWAFGYPGAQRARSQPMFAMGAVFVGSQDGTVYALDQDTGCVRWTFRATAEVRTPVIIEPWDAASKPNTAPVAYLADHMARIYAVNALTGKLIWAVKVDDHPNATITGSPALHEGRLYVPISSLEVSNTADPQYACCTFRGAMVALDAVTGKQLWKTHTIAQEPKFVGNTSVGIPIYAPSGAPIWNSPTLDPANGLLYAGTGENYSSPANDTSDALLAFRMTDGKLLWSRQTTQGDAWNGACMLSAEHPNCPAENGPDHDYGAGTMRVLLTNGKQLLLAGQKSGVVYALDIQHKGEIVWQKKVGRGGIQGGVHFGMAYDGKRLYVPISDMNNREAESYAWNIPGKAGLYALDVANGNILWGHPADNICREDQTYCEPGISAAITAIPGVVFAGHMDGRLRAYAASDGLLLWEFETDAREFKTVNGVQASGGSFGGGSGPMVHGGMLFANSGYGLYYHRPGNVLLAFSVDGK